MRKTPLLAAIVLSVAVGAPRFAAAVETNSPAPPAPQNAQPSGTTTTKQKTKKPKTGSADKFLNDWHKAYALVYDKGDYVGGIAVLRAMGYDDNVDVATLIGYASRKLALRRRQILVRQGARRRSEPRADLVLLRHVAGRARQSC